MTEEQFNEMAKIVLSKEPPFGKLVKLKVFIEKLKEQWIKKT